MTTPHFAIEEVAAAQAQKHVTVNEALHVIDQAINLVVVRRDLSDPPVDPAEGDRYVVAAPASGAWTGREGQIAAFVNGIWHFFTPEIGWRVYDRSAADLLVWSGSGWNSFLESAMPRSFGVNTGADSYNRLAIKSDAALFSHDDVTPGSGDIRLTLNKKSAGNTASLLLQTGYSGRAEVGISGSDALELKASADGAAWVNSLLLDPAGHTFRVTLNGQERGRWTEAGLGIGTLSPTSLLDVNSDRMRLRNPRTPASPTDSGNQGDICWDASFIYVCTAPNTWRRAALSTW